MKSRLLVALLAWSLSLAARSQDLGPLWVQPSHSQRFVAKYAGPYLLTASLDNTTKIYRGEDGKFLDFLAPAGYNTAISAAPDGRLVALWWRYGPCRVYSLPDRILRATLDDAGAFSTDGRWLATYQGTSGLVYVRRASDFSIVAVLPGQSSGSSAGREMLFLPDGHLVTYDYSSAQYLIKVYQPETWQLEQVVSQGPIIKIAASPDARHFAEILPDHTICVYSWPDLVEERRLIGHASDVFDATFSPDSQRIASCSLDGTIRVWSVRDGSVLGMMTDAGGPPVSVSYTPDGAGLATASSTLKVWNAASFQLDRELTTPAMKIVQTLLTQDAKKAIILVDDGSLRIYDAASGTRESMVTPPSPIRSLQIDRSSNTIFCGCDDGAVRVIDLTGQQVRVFPGLSSAAIKSIDVSLDGSSFALTDLTRVKICSTVTGAVTKTLTQSRNTGNVRFSPTKDRIAYTTEDGVLYCRWLDTNVLQAKFFVFRTWGPLAFSQDGARLVLSEGNQAQKTTCYDLASNKALFDFDGLFLGESPSTHHVLTALDGVVRAFDALSGKQSQLWSGRGPVLQFAFGASGSRVLAAGWEGSLWMNRDLEGPQRVTLGP